MTEERGAFRWFKLIIENQVISRNKWLILLIVGGIAGGGAQEVRYSGYIPEPTPEDQSKEITPKTAPCKQYIDQQINQHKRRYHP